MYFRNQSSDGITKAFKLEIYVEEKKTIELEAMKNFSISLSKRFQTNFRNVIEKPKSTYRNMPF